MRKKKKLACWLAIVLIIASPFIYWMMENHVKTFLDAAIFGLLIGNIILDFLFFFAEILREK